MKHSLFHSFIGKVALFLLAHSWVVSQSSASRLKRDGEVNLPPVHTVRESVRLYDEDDGMHQCVRIEEPICDGLQYIHTKFPNPVGLASQDEAAKRMNDYRALISVSCSHYLKFFLCTVYFPMCASTPTSIQLLQPCRSFCRYVQSKCEPIMKSFSFPWPIELACHQLPEESAMCIQPHTYELDQRDTGTLSGVDTRDIAQLLPNLNNLLHGKLGESKERTVTRIDSSDTNLQPSLIRPGSIGVTQSFSCSIVDISIVVDAESKNRTCARRCSANLFYQASEKRFADIWLLLWSVLCAISCALTLITFLMDRARFVYPERPIVYISACYLCYAIGHLLRLLVGRERVACQMEISDQTIDGGPEHFLSKLLPPHMLQSGSNDPINLSPAITMESNKYLILSGHESTWCTIVFIFIYYFSQASYVWWAMLALAWFLSAACKWAYEGIEAVSGVLHLVAWALPAIKTILVLVLHRIDADELTGLCSVGFQNPTSLLLFVILPQLAYLMIGIGLLLFGFIALASVRTSLRHHITKHVSKPDMAAVVSSRRESPETVEMNPTIIHANVRRLDKLMARIGIFSMLYIIPSLCVIGANVYDYLGQPKWAQSVMNLAHHRPECLTTQGLDWSKPNQCLSTELPFPMVEVRMLNLFMSLVVGITAGMWVWCNRKTMKTWMHCTARGPDGKRVSGTPLSKNSCNGKKISVKEKSIRLKTRVERYGSDRKNGEQVLAINDPRHHTEKTQSPITHAPHRDENFQQTTPMEMDPHVVSSGCGQYPPYPTARSFHQPIGGTISSAWLNPNRTSTTHQLC